MTWFTPLDNILEAGDEIIWRGYINRKALVLNLIIILAFFVIFGGFLFTYDVLDLKNTNTGQISKVSGSLKRKLVFRQNGLILNQKIFDVLGFGVIG